MPTPNVKQQPPQEGREIRVSISHAVTRAQHDRCHRLQNKSKPSRSRKPCHHVRKETVSEQIKITTLKKITDCVRQRRQEYYDDDRAKDRTARDRSHIETTPKSITSTAARELAEVTEFLIDRATRGLAGLL